MARKLTLSGFLSRWRAHKNIRALKNAVFKEFLSDLNPKLRSGISIRWGLDHFGKKASNPSMPRANNPRRKPVIWVVPFLQESQVDAAAHIYEHADAVVFLQRSTQRVFEDLVERHLFTRTYGHLPNLVIRPTFGVLDQRQAPVTSAASAASAASAVITVTGSNRHIDEIQEFFAD